MVTHAHEIPSEEHSMWLGELMGVYKITNWATGHFYIGGSVHLKRRIREHRNKLRRGRHENQRLQEAWDKYGEESFSFEVLELVPRPNVLREMREIIQTTESGWINKLRPDNELIGYNLTNNTRSPRLGHKADAVLRKRISESQKEIPKPKPEGFSETVKRSWMKRSRIVPPEVIAKRSVAMTGRKRPPEFGQKLAVMFKGRPVSEEARRKISATLTGRPGKPRTAAQRLAQSERQKARGHAPGPLARERMLQAITGRKLTEEHKKKCSEALKGRKHSEETKYKIGSGNRGKTFTAEQRAAMSAGWSRRRERLAKEADLRGHMRIVKLDQDVVRLVYTTDWHLTDTAPGRRTASYAEEILAKIKFVGDLALKINGVSLCGGDVWHSKSPKAAGNTFSLVNRLIHVLREHPFGKVWGVHGNHDILADRSDSIPSQPLGSLIAAQVFEDLSSTGSVIFENRDGSSRVQVDAYPYTSNDLFALERVLNAKPREEGVTHRIVLMHQYGDPGDEPSMFGHPTIGFNRMAGCDYDFALWGHDHSRTETVKVGNCTHVRLGSLARAALAEDEVDREIAAAVLSFKGTKVGFKEVPVPVQPLQIAFVAAARQVEMVQESAAVVSFLQDMDVAVDTIASTDERIVLRAVCPKEDTDIYDEAVELCGL